MAALRFYRRGYHESRERQSTGQPPGHVATPESRSGWHRRGSRARFGLGLGGAISHWRGCAMSQFVGHPHSGSSGAILGGLFRALLAR